MQLIEFTIDDKKEIESLLKRVAVYSNSIATIFSNLSTYFLFNETKEKFEESLEDNKTDIEKELQDLKDNVIIILRCMKAFCNLREDTSLEIDKKYIDFVNDSFESVRKNYSNFILFINNNNQEILKKSTDIYFSYLQCIRYLNGALIKHNIINFNDSNIPIKEVPDPKYIILKEPLSEFYVSFKNEVEKLLNET